MLRFGLLQSSPLNQNLGEAGTATYSSNPAITSTEGPGSTGLLVVCWRRLLSIAAERHHLRLRCCCLIRVPCQGHKCSTTCLTARLPRGHRPCAPTSTCRCATAFSQESTRILSRYLCATGCHDSKPPQVSNLGFLVVELVAAGSRIRVHEHNLPVLSPSLLGYSCE